MSGLSFPPSVFSSTQKGLVPASGGGTANFLRADGSFAAPGGGGSPWDFLPPTAASMTLGSGDATNLVLTDDADAGLLIDGGAPVAGPLDRVAYRTLTDKTLDWDLIVKLDCTMPTTNFSGFGLYMGDSVAGVGRNFDLVSNGNSDVVNLSANFSGTRTSVGTVVTPYWRPKWWRIQHTGGNYIYSMSICGKNWSVCSTIADTSHLVNRADRVGIQTFYQRTTGIKNMLCCSYFSLTGPGV